MKNRMRLAAAALALSMAGFGLTGCGGETKETAAKTEAADKQAGVPRRQIPRQMGTRPKAARRKEVGQRTARGTRWPQPVRRGQ
ncbi:MAG: hypothetical protein ACLR0U_09520 [Enterocloster clostridioformis]